MGLYEWTKVAYLCMSKLDRTPSILGAKTQYLLVVSVTLWVALLLLLLLLLLPSVPNILLNTRPF